MTETQLPDEPGVGTRGSFKRADAAEQNIERMAFILDQMAARPAVRTLSGPDRRAFHMSLTMYAVSAVKPRAARGT